MKKLLFMLLALGIAAAVTGLISAQSDSNRGPKDEEAPASNEAQSGDSAAQPPEDEAPAPAKKKPAKAAKEAEDASGEVAPPGSSDKDMVTNYYKGRVGQLRRFYVEQETFGKKFTFNWEEFWKKLFDKRQNFEKNMAKLRLNHFDLLKSLSAASQDQATLDFERQQTNLTRAFEQEQKDDMGRFFYQVDVKLKQFSADQEKQRAEFIDQFLSSWDKQKKVVKKGKPGVAEPAAPAPEKNENRKWFGGSSDAEPAATAPEKKEKRKWFPSRERSKNRPQGL